VDDQHTRDAIVLATLPEVAFEGWTDRALRRGVADAGLPPEAALRFFPGGIPDVVSHWSVYGDRKMLERLGSVDLGALRTGERIAACVRARIEANGRHQREAVRRVLSYLALPTNTVLAARLTYDTVNVMWYAAGDTSADFSFYTKRALLGAVYGATLLYWLDDESEDCADTWSFLARRLDDVMQIPRLGSAMGDSLRRLDPRRWFAGGRRSFPD
jgi:ubiquinone biosynthesis protein COQ9